MSAETAPESDRALTALVGVASAGLWFVLVLEAMVTQTTVSANAVMGWLALVTIGATLGVSLRLLRGTFVGLGWVRGSGEDGDGTDRLARGVWASFALAVSAHLVFQPTWEHWYALAQALLAVLGGLALTRSLSGPAPRRD